MTRSQSSALKCFEEGLAKLDAHHERQRRDTALIALREAGVTVEAMMGVMRNIGFPYRDIDALKKAISRARTP